MQKTWSCLAALTCGTLAFACTDDTLPAHGNHDASAGAEDASTTSGGRTTSSARTSGTATSSAIDVDAGLSVDAALGDGRVDVSLPDADASVLVDVQADAGPDADAAALDAALPADAQVFVPDGGVVLRPTELPFQEDQVENLVVPEGFAVGVFAIPGGKARMLAVHDGAVYVTRPQEGDVLRLEDTDNDGVADVTTTAVSGYPTVHGITFDEGTVYLATATELVRGSVLADGSFGAMELLFDDLPDGGQHPLRTLGIGPDGLLYLSVGSSCDACEETNEEHATLLQVALDGATRVVFASGLRNTIGFGWHPETGQLWGMDNGSDWRGNELPPEELNRIEQGGNYGWPYCYAKQAIDPIIADPVGTTKALYCATTVSSVLENQAHEAPIGLVFYDALAFPEQYRGDAFVAMRGSWNRVPATGYKIVRVVFNEGQPTGIEDFVTGFLDQAGTATFGRPAGITVDSSGALLFTDDTNGVVYRVSYD